MLDTPLDSLVQTALSANPHLTSRHLRFETHEGRVTLRGVVPSYYQKLMAQEALLRIEGVAKIENELQVDWV